MVRKFLFLDIDGVLNDISTPLTLHGVKGIDDDKVAILKTIIEQTGAHVILISSWKEHWHFRKEKKASQDELANYLDERLASFGLKIMGKIVDSDYGGRGKSILDYLAYFASKGHPVTYFAILDDEYGDYKQTSLLGHLVKTNYRRGGLNLKAAEKAIRILNQEEN